MRIVMLLMCLIAAGAARASEEASVEAVVGEAQDAARAKLAAEAAPRPAPVPAVRVAKTEPEVVPPQAGRYHEVAKRWSIVPPAGFGLVSTGVKTIWRGPGGLEVLVETEEAPRGTPLGDWVDLHLRYQRARGKRYRLLAIERATVAGLPGAIWDFELDGVRKVDYAAHTDDRGYAVMISGPVSAFARHRDVLDDAVRSFQISGNLTLR